MSFSIQSNAAQPVRDAQDIVDRQFIVLFSATTGGFKGNVVAASASNASVNAGLYARLGSPASGTRLLEGLTSPAAQAKIEKFPNSPRAYLENYVLLTYPSAASATAAMKLLQKDEQVLSVEQNALLQFFTTPNDRYFSLNPYDPSPGNYQWGMQLLKIPQAWDKIRGNAYIADADSGIAYATRNLDGTLTACSIPSATCLPHPDLAQNLRPHMSRNLTGTGYSNEFVDPTTHGTHVAGIMAATPEHGAFSNNWNNSGVAGACWTCSFSELKIIPTRGAGFCAKGNLRLRCAVSTHKGLDSGSDDYSRLSMTKSYSAKEKNMKWHARLGLQAVGLATMTDQASAQSAVVSFSPVELSQVPLSPWAMAILAIILLFAARKVFGRSVGKGTAWLLLVGCVLLAPPRSWLSEAGAVAEVTTFDLVFPSPVISPPLPWAKNITVVNRTGQTIRIDSVMEQNEGVHWYNIWSPQLAPECTQGLVLSPGAVCYTWIIPAA